MDLRLLDNMLRCFHMNVFAADILLESQIQDQKVVDFENGTLIISYSAASLPPRSCMKTYTYTRTIICLAFNSDVPHLYVERLPNGCLSSAFF